METNGKRLHQIDHGAESLFDKLHLQSGKTQTNGRLTSTNHTMHLRQTPRHGKSKLYFCVLVTTVGLLQSSITQPKGLVI